MLKWIRTKILKGIIKDLLGEIPSIKNKALKYFEAHHEEILEKVKIAIKKAIMDFTAEKF